MSILSLTFCLENDIYIFMEILKMMVFFHVSHLFSNQYKSLQSTEPLYLEIFLNWQVKISLTYYCWAMSLSADASTLAKSMSMPLSLVTVTRNQ